MSTQDDVCELFKEILNNAEARNKSNFTGLEQSAFSYDLSEDGLARISGYLHTKPQFVLTDSAVRNWIFDERIKGEVEWTPVFPGQNGDFLAKTGNGSSIPSSAASWLPATVAPVASRTWWATARTRSIGEGAPAQPARQAALQSRVACQTTASGNGQPSTGKGIPSG